MTRITGHAGSNKLGQKKSEGELGQTKTEQRKGKERAPAPDPGPRLWGRRGCRIDCWKDKQRAMARLECVPGSLLAPDFRQPTKFHFQETFFMHNFLVLKPYNLCTKILHIIFFPNNWSGNILQQTFVIHKTFTYNFFQSTFQKIFHDIQLTCITFLENLSDDIFQHNSHDNIIRKTSRTTFMHKFTIQLPMKILKKVTQFNSRTQGTPQKKKRKQILLIHVHENKYIGK